MNRALTIHCFDNNQQHHRQGDYQFVELNFYYQTKPSFKFITSAESSTIFSWKCYHSTTPPPKLLSSHPSDPKLPFSFKTSFNTQTVLSLSLSLSLSKIWFFLVCLRASCITKMTCCVVRLK
jgi:hypothetical protein